MLLWLFMMQNVLRGRTNLFEGELHFTAFFVGSSIAMLILLYFSLRYAFIGHPPTRLTPLYGGLACGLLAAAIFLAQGKGLHLNPGTLWLALGPLPPGLVLIALGHHANRSLA